MNGSIESDREKGALIRFFSNPVVGFTGSFASVIGVVLAVYFFLDASKRRELTYFVHPVRAIVVKTGETSRLSVAYDGKDVKTDLTAVQIAVWNQGRETIRKSDVLRPLVIKTEAPILEAIIRKETRPGIVGLKLDESERENGRLGVSWEILEGNDGGIVQLLFAGGSSVKVTAEVVLEGQREIKSLAFSGSIKSPTDQYSTARREEILAGFGSLSLGGCMVLFYIIVMRRVSAQLRLRTKRNEEKMREWEALKSQIPELKSVEPVYSSTDITKPRNYLKINILLISLFTSGMGFYLLLWRRPPTPPFDF